MKTQLLYQQQHVSRFKAVAQAVTALICVQEVTGSNLGRDIEYPHWLFRCFRQSRQTNVRIVP
jgi:hypothetical protein